MTTQLAAVIIVCFGGGLLAGVIAYSRLGGAGTFVGYFIFGALLPLIGVIVACVVKPAPKPPGWLPDPWREAPLRWWDGTQWTYHLGGLPAEGSAGQPQWTPRANV